MYSAYVSKHNSNCKKTSYFLNYSKQRCIALYRSQNLICFVTTQPARRRPDDVASTSVCTSQRRGVYDSNETPSEVSMNVGKMSQWYVSRTSYWNIMTTS